MNLKGDGDGDILPTSHAGNIEENRLENGIASIGEANVMFPNDIVFITFSSDK